MADGVARANPRAAALRILPLLELTGSADDENGLRALCAKAKTPFGPLAAVCVAPRFVALAKEHLAGSLVRVATLADAPDGIAAAVTAGADEVEIALPDDGAGAFVRQCRVACRRAGGANALLKVNLESGRIGDPARIPPAALEAIEAGADMVAITAARTRRIWAGIKVAGGIRTLSEAVGYLSLAEQLLGSEFLSPATFRFGSADLLDDLRTALGNSARD
jgi:deoxyribose-phosphate aldolase